jgi:(R,R)-butanediol dehydrogenase/meso-butanediol dehydrogenase/diacetyl reductase
MRAAVFHGRGDIRVETVPDPVVAPGELLLEVHVAGICGTDAHEFSDGPHMMPIHTKHAVTGHVGPMIPGHELTGRIVEIGDGVDGFEIGAVVASGGGVWCGACTACDAGRTNLCERYSTVGLSRNGGLAQYCRVPAMTCLAIDQYGITEDTAGLGQPMAIGVHAMRRGRLAAGEDAAIVGAGGIGAFLTYAAVQQGASVGVVDLDVDRLEVASRLGAQQTHVASQGSAAEAFADHDLEPAVVYEVSGHPAGLATALELIQPGGRLVLVGLHEGDLAANARQLTLSEIEVVGTNAHVCDVDLPRALELLGTRSTPWDDVAPVALPLDQLVSGGIAPIVEGSSKQIKTLIDPWSQSARATNMTG